MLNFLIKYKEIKKILVLFENFDLYSMEKSLYDVNLGEKALNKI